ncbi:MAG: serine/threonine-protein kinase, partial [Candidatus Binatia bacterium]
MESEPPRTIGRYRVVRALGSGGMGTVYLAEDPALKRAVALKVVQGGLREQQQALARFRREAEISARLNHPNVITIYDVGEDAGVGPFITMEFVNGRSLAVLLAETNLPSETRLALLVQAGRALDVAHAAGIVHRDVKPQNLIVSGDGRVKLMDFGVARSDDSTLTVTGVVLGTPAYMAPEQIDGAQPSIATDTYAFAVLAFEALCGQRPYTAETVSKLLYQIVHEPPTFPPGLDAGLRTVFEKALAKSPADR